jgi:hypothetical protein
MPIACAAISSEAPNRPGSPACSGRVNAVAAGFQRRMGEELVKQSAEQLLTSMKQQLER